MRLSQTMLMIKCLLNCLLQQKWRDMSNTANFTLSKKKIAWWLVQPVRFSFAWEPGSQKCYNIKAFAVHPWCLLIQAALLKNQKLVVDQNLHIRTGGKTLHQSGTVGCVLNRGQTNTRVCIQSGKQNHMTVSV